MPKNLGEHFGGIHREPDEASLVEARQNLAAKGKHLRGKIPSCPLTASFREGFKEAIGLRTPGLDIFLEQDPE